MNGKKAKLARRVARAEMANDPRAVAERELFVAEWRGHDRLINDPFSQRGFSRAIKKAYKKSIQRGHAV